MKQLQAPPGVSGGAPSAPGGAAALQGAPNGPSRSAPACAAPTPAAPYQVPGGWRPRPAHAHAPPEPPVAASAGAVWGRQAGGLVAGARPVPARPAPFPPGGGAPARPATQQAHAQSAALAPPVRPRARCARRAGLHAWRQSAGVCFRSSSLRCRHPARPLDAGPERSCALAVRAACGRARARVRAGVRRPGGAATHAEPGGACGRATRLAGRDHHGRRSCRQRAACGAAGQHGRAGGAAPAAAASAGARAPAAAARRAGRARRADGGLRRPRGGGGCGGERPAAGGSGRRGARPRGGWAGARRRGGPGRARGAWWPAAAGCRSAGACTWWARCVTGASVQRARQAVRSGGDDLVHKQRVRLYA